MCVDQKSAVRLSVNSMLQNSFLRDRLKRSAGRAPDAMKDTVAVCPGGRVQEIAKGWKKIWIRVRDSEAPELRLGAPRKAGQRQTYASA